MNDIIIVSNSPAQDPDVQISPPVHAATVSAHLQTLLSASQIAPVA